MNTTKKILLVLGCLSIGYSIYAIITTIANKSEIQELTNEKNEITSRLIPYNLERIAHSGDNHGGDDHSDICIYNTTYIECPPKQYYFVPSNKFDVCAENVCILYNNTCASNNIIPIDIDYCNVFTSDIDKEISSTTGSIIRKCIFSVFIVICWCIYFSDNNYNKLSETPTETPSDIHGFIV